MTQPKNYNDDGGDELVIGGTLRFLEGAVIVNFPSGADTPTWDEITGKPTTFPAANIGVAGGPVGPVIAQGKVVYGNNEGGTYSPVAYDEAASAFALVMRDISGNFSVKDPTAATNPASMQWVQAQVATAIPLAQKGVANGVATLDASGKVPTAQVNVSGLNYLGTWNATTNVPALTNGTGTAGDFYKVAVAGSHDFGAGAIEFVVGDWVIYEGGVWQQVGSHEAVASVNGKTGAVVLVAADVGAVDLTTAQTVAGVKTFSDSPTVPVPSDGIQAANKNYVDAQIDIVNQAKVDLTTAQTVAGVKTFSASPAVPTPTTATQAAPKSYVDSSVAAAVGAISSNTGNYGAPSAYSGGGDVEVEVASPMVHLVSATTDDVFIRLADAPTGTVKIIKRMNASAHGFHITPDVGSAALIDGVNDIGMSAQYSHRVVISDGTNWSIIGGSGA